MNKKENLIWIDTELTGLNWSENKILEISIIVTDSELKIYRNRFLKK